MSTPTVIKAKEQENPYEYTAHCDDCSIDEFKIADGVDGNALNLSFEHIFGKLRPCMEDDKGSPCFNESIVKFMKEFRPCLNRLLLPQMFAFSSKSLQSITTIPHLTELDLSDSAMLGGEQNTKSDHDLAIKGLTALLKKPEFISLDISSNYLSYREVECIAAKSKYLRCLRIRDNSLTAAGVVKLVKIPSLTHLDISDNKECLDLDTAFTIANNKQLQELKVAGAISTKEPPAKVAARIAARLAHNHTLVKLDVSKNPIEDYGACALALNSSLQALSAADCKIGPEGGKALATIESLIELDLSENKKMGDFVINALAQNQNLKILKIANADLNDDNALDFALNQTLEKLDLSGNYITDKGATAIAAHPNLTELNLADNNITNETAKAIAVNKKLTAVNLSQNPQIGYAGTLALAQNRTLTSIDLDECAITLEQLRLLEPEFMKNPNLIHLSIAPPEGKEDEIAERWEIAKRITEKHKQYLRAWSLVAVTTAAECVAKDMKNTEGQTLSGAILPLLTEITDFAGIPRYLPKLKNAKTADEAHPATVSSSTSSTDSQVATSATATSLSTTSLVSRLTSSTTESLTPSASTSSTDSRVVTSFSSSSSPAFFPSSPISTSVIATSTVAASEITNSANSAESPSTNKRQKVGETNETAGAAATSTQNNEPVQLKHKPNSAMQNYNMSL